MIDFVWKVKKTFRKVRKEIEELKDNSNEWIVFLDEKNTETEKKLDKIENKIDRLEEAMFRILQER